MYQLFIVMYISYLSVPNKHHLSKAGHNFAIAIELYHPFVTLGRLVDFPYWKRTLLSENFVDLGQVTMSEINLARSLYLFGDFNMIYLAESCLSDNADRGTGDVVRRISIIEEVLRLRLSEFVENVISFQCFF